MQASRLARLMLDLPVEEEDGTHGLRCLACATVYPSTTATREQVLVGQHVCVSWVRFGRAV